MIKLKRACEPAIGGGGGVIGTVELDHAMLLSPSQPTSAAGVSTNAGVLTVALTWSRIHIPAAPCPGTPQKMRYSPAGAAAKRITSVPSEGRPCASLSVKARGMAGSPGCGGSGLWR